MDDAQQMLTAAIENLEIDLARMLIVENEMEPHYVSEEKMWHFIQNVLQSNDKPLLRQLFKYDNRLNGRILWSVLDNIAVATMLVNAGADLNIPKDDWSTTTVLHVLAASKDPSKLELAELMIDKGADVSAVDDEERSVLQCAIEGGASVDFIRKIIWNSVADFTRNALTIGNSVRSAELTPALISLIKNNSVDEKTRYERVKDAVLKLIGKSVLERIPESRRVVIEAFLDTTMSGDMLDSRDNSIRETLKLKSKFESVCEMTETEKELANAIKNLDMELAHTLIVEKNVKPKDVDEEDILSFIQNVALMNDELLLKKLCQIDKNSVLIGRLLWNVLDNIEVATMFVRAGADLSVRDAVTDETFLQVLSTSDDPEKRKLAELIIDHGADVSTVNSRNHSVLRCAINAGAPEKFIPKLTLSIDAKNSNGRRRIELPPPVLDNKPEIRIKQVNDAISVLTGHSARLQTLESRRQAAELLLMYAEPDDIFNQKGKPVVESLMLNRDFEVAKLFFERGASPNVLTNMLGWSYLWIASTLKDSSLATLLIRKGADINLCNRDGEYPIHGAFNGHSINNVLLMIRLGVDINVVNYKGTTPFLMFFQQVKHSPEKDIIYKFVTRYLALVTYKNSGRIVEDIEVIDLSGNRDLYERCLKELRHMQELEGIEDIPYYTLLAEPVERISEVTRRSDVISIFENQPRLRKFFPSYFGDIRNAYVFAKEREHQLETRRQCLYNIVFELYQLELPIMVINKIESYFCSGDLQNIMLDAHEHSCPSMVWD